MLLASTGLITAEAPRPPLLIKITSHNQKQNCILANQP
uniref:Uncharacterized protein n=1 Tax=Anguilla anguilla TaxID=7936 RepID=A0A0E9WIV9_ANGAN